MNRIRRVLEEFVDVSDYKIWSKSANKEFYNKIGEYFKKFEDHDKNYNRIYFDLKIDPDRFKVEVPEEIADFMRWYRYPIVDYDKGICREHDGREIRIGRLLTKLGETELLKTYNNSKQNILKNVTNLKIVISRHPYDIIGMSTNRGWTTCHDLHDKRYKGDHLQGVSNILERGCLIAYLIRENDRNITNPLARCIIRSGFNALSVDNHIYGTNVPEFKEFILQWVRDYMNDLYL